jgi:hypothetical protein
MHKSGLVDTMFDLIICLIGSLIVGTLGYIYLRDHKGDFFRNILRYWNRYYNQLNDENKKSSLVLD